MRSRIVYGLPPWWLLIGLDVVVVVLIVTAAVYGSTSRAWVAVILAWLDIVLTVVRLRRHR